jgi:hypothetical protein
MAIGMGPPAPAPVEGGSGGGPNAVWQANRKAYRLTHTTLALRGCDAVSRISAFGTGAERDHLLRQCCDKSLVCLQNPLRQLHFLVFQPSLDKDGIALEAQEQRRIDSALRP